MSKLNDLKTKLISLLKELKANWSTPREGEYCTIKELTCYAAGQAGSYVFLTVSAVLAFGANYFCGGIMKIANLDFTKISIITIIINLLLIFTNPVGTEIYENHGKIGKKSRIIAHLCYSGKIIVGICFYLLPMTLFEGIPKIGMIAMPQIIGNILVVGGISDYLTWLIRKLFCEKYGRIKPFFILYGLPTAIIAIIIPYINYDSFSYATKLIVLHFSFTLMAYFYNYFININSMVVFMTPNSQERQRIFSVVPVITGVVPSIINLFFPILIGLTGGYLSLKTYKIFTPIFTITGVALSLFAISCKERVIEKKGKDRVKVTFFKGAKQAFKNKYFWITNISNIFSGWTNTVGPILQLWCIYSLRIEWFYGVASSIVIASYSIGSLLTPILTKRLEKRTVVAGSKLVSCFCVAIMFLAIKFGGIAGLAIFMFAMFLRNLLIPIETTSMHGVNADIMDYHQWRFGERADSVAGVFGWFISPITAGISYIIPALLLMVGYTSDWDILYNPDVITKVFNIYIWFNIIGLIASAIPYFFYDLTNAKHEACINEMKQRLLDEAEKEGVEVDQIVFSGTNKKETVNEQE